jgi:ubiquinone/menaquinone biosynthesis C-methylase UbiE
MKSYLLKLYYFGNLSKETTNKNQKTIRDTEWLAISEYIKQGKFLDVGCGAGYSMQLAQAMGNEVFGIDPDPGGHGVGREGSNFKIDVEIKKGFAEKIDFESQTFDTVYSSHVLEHVNSEDHSLLEMKRVLKDNGVLIIGMPTNFMAKLNFFSSIVFTTHHKVFNLLMRPFFKTGNSSFKEIFLPKSHSHEGKTVFFDMQYYKIENWKKIVSKHFTVREVLLPAYYPYPETYQFFKIHKHPKKSSSVFFICSK